MVGHGEEIWMINVLIISNTGTWAYREAGCPKCEASGFSVFSFHHSSCVAGETSEVEFLPKKLVKLDEHVRLVGRFC